MPEGWLATAWLMGQAPGTLMLNCVVVSDWKVSKMCLLMSYANDSFLEEYVLSVRPVHSQVTLGGKQYFLGLYDTVRQEAYDCLGPLSNK